MTRVVMYSMSFQACLRASPVLTSVLTYLQTSMQYLWQPNQLMTGLHRPMDPIPHGPHPTFTSILLGILLDRRAC